jgi:hypothetical protein
MNKYPIRVVWTEFTLAGDMSNGRIVRTDEQAKQLEVKIQKVVSEWRLLSPVYLSAENSIIGGVVDTQEAPPPRK